MKIVVTGGHLTPAMAVIQELISRFGKEAEIIYIGRKYTFEGSSTIATEYEIIPTLNVKYLVLNAGRLQRKITRHTPVGLLKIPFGFIQSLHYLLKYKPQVVLSFGGYLSLPVVINAWILRIPILIHEQTVVLGLANRVGAFFASRICLSWRSSQKYFPKGKTVITGNPIRQAIFQKFDSLSQKDKENRLGLFLSKIKPEEKLIYITGGNQGSQVVNQALLRILPKLLLKYYVIHQTGSLDFNSIREEVEKMEKKLRERYYFASWFCDSEHGWNLNRADLIISRSGANTTAELLALKKIAVLIPLPWAGGNEQFKNAEILVKYGLGKIFPQSELERDRLYGVIQKMMERITGGDFKIAEIENRLKREGGNLPFNGAKKLVDEILDLIKMKS